MTACMSGGGGMTVCLSGGGVMTACMSGRGGMTVCLSGGGGMTACMSGRGHCRRNDDDDRRNVKCVGTLQCTHLQHHLQHHSGITSFMFQQWSG